MSMVVPLHNITSPRRYTVTDTNKAKQSLQIPNIASEIFRIVCPRKTSPTLVDFISQVAYASYHTRNTNKIKDAK